jgi:6-pyruvoyltetrahydropterin/6-carboxytetrahydropterin synthase
LWCVLLIYSLTIQGRFAASHQIEGHELCGHLHGHTYLVDLTIVGDPNPETFSMVANDVDARLALNDLLYELNNRHLNDQLPAVIPSPQGIANWIWERLALRFQLYEVTVWQDDLGASVSRE